MATIQIQKGSTLSQIARERGTTIENIQRLNPQITDPNLIQTGASLAVPDLPTPAAPRGAAPTIVDTDGLRKRVRGAEERFREIEEREPPKRKVPTLEETLFEIEDIGEAEEELFFDFSRQIQDVQRGAVKFTPDEQAQLANIESTFANIAKEQRIINLQRTGITTRLAGRAGRTRFAPELAEQEISVSIQTGIDKIADINIQTQAALGEARQAIRDKNFKQIIETNDRLNSFLKSRKDTVRNIQNSILAVKQEQRMEKQFALDLREKGLNIAIKNVQLEQERLELDAARTAISSGEVNGQILTPKQQSAAFKLSDDFESASKDFITQAAARTRVIASAKDPSAAGDLALVFNFMKTLDPASVVRESEFKTAAEAASFANRTYGSAIKFQTGKLFTSEVRQDLVNRTESIYQAGLQDQRIRDEQFRERSARFGVPSDVVVRDVASSAEVDISDVADEASSALDRKIETGIGVGIDLENIFSTASNLLELN